MVNFYTWNTQALVNWLRQELSTGIKPDDLCEELCASRSVFQEWMVLPFPEITAEQICAIAHYRHQDCDTVIEWLGIKPAHMEELLERSLRKRQGLFQRQGTMEAAQISLSSTYADSWLP